MLAEWEQVRAKIKTFQCKFQLLVFGPVPLSRDSARLDPNKPTGTDEGELRYIVRRTGDVSRRGKIGGSQEESPAGKAGLRRPFDLRIYLRETAGRGASPPARQARHAAMDAAPCPSFLAPRPAS